MTYGTSEKGAYHLQKTLCRLSGSPKEVTAEHGSGFAETAVLVRGLPSEAVRAAPGTTAAVRARLARRAVRRTRTAAGTSPSPGLTYLEQQSVTERT